MKRSNMKSNISLQPRCRPEGRLFPRRKVAVKSHLFNGVGDFDMELSLAIQESLKYAQQEKEEGLRENGLCNSNDPRSADSDSRQDTSSLSYSRHEQSRIANKIVNHESATASPEWTREEVGRLKDLLTSQAELIQCQQDEIAEKDREIKSLRSSRDALQCRLERMERRMSILKQKEELHDGHGTVAGDAAGRIPSSSHTASHKGSNEISNIEFKKKRRRGHKLNFSQRKRHKRQRFVKPATDRKRTAEEEEDDSDEEEDEDSSDGSEDEDSQSDLANSESYIEENENENNFDNVPEQEEKVIDYPIMQTETMYHLYYPKHRCPSPDAKKLQEQSEVETPSWRLKPMTNMYQLEGTENITDEAYFKRHQKFELEEKRRKRWDLQRLRELRMFEKQQRQREDEIRASQDEADVETFLPSIHDLKHIEITDNLPVMAFGQPVPYVSPAEFEIPWEITNSGALAATSRQRIGSVHSRRH